MHCEYLDIVLVCPDAKVRGFPERLFGRSSIRYKYLCQFIQLHGFSTQIEPFLLSD
jgi:hypothetical protein